MQPVSKINDGRNSITQWLVFNNLRVTEINFKMIKKNKPLPQIWILAEAFTLCEVRTQPTMK